MRNRPSRDYDGATVNGSFALALLLPALTLLMVAAGEGAGALNAYHVLAHAAAAGAQTARPSAPAVIARVIAAAGAGGVVLRSANVRVAPNAAPARASATCVNVTVTYRYPLPFLPRPAAIPLTARAHYRSAP